MQLIMKSYGNKKNKTDNLSQKCNTLYVFWSEIFLKTYCDLIKINWNYTKRAKCWKHANPKTLIIHKNTDSVRNRTPASRYTVFSVTNHSIKPIDRAVDWLSIQSKQLKMSLVFKLKPPKGRTNWRDSIRPLCF